MDTKRVDFSLERDDFLVDWTDIIDETPYIYENVYRLCSTVTTLPEHKIQLPVLLSYILCPSAMATRIPICFLHGQSGTGKSQVGMLAAKLYNATVFGATSTFASIRNDLDMNKWEVDPAGELPPFEQNYLLVWDDIEANRISPTAGDGKIFSLLKSGVNRETSTVKIAQIGGKNVEFNTFGGKIISSIHPVWDFPGLEELKRRALPIFFERADIDYSADVESINLVTLWADNKRFWLTDNRRAEYKGAKRYFLSKNCELPVGIKQMWADLMATLYVHLLQVDNSINYFKVELIFEQYNAIREERMKATVLTQVLELYLLDKIEETVLKNREFLDNGYPELTTDYVEVSSLDVFNFLKDRANDGSIEIRRVENQVLHQLMQKNGFKQKPSKTGLAWVKKI